LQAYVGGKPEEVSQPFERNYAMLPLTVGRKGSAWGDSRKQPIFDKEKTEKKKDPTRPETFLFTSKNKTSAGNFPRKGSKRRLCRKRKKQRRG